MQNLIDKIDAVEKNARAMLEQRNQYVDEINQLRHELGHHHSTIKKLEDRITVLENDNKDLRTANAMLGSNEHKRETKLKINSLIKEIDQCIVQLSE